MRRSEVIALLATILLLLIAGALFVGAVYTVLIGGGVNVALSTGALAVLGQAIVAGLAYWGLRLTRQRVELLSIPVLGESSVEQQSVASMTGFRMSAADDVAEEITKRRGLSGPPVSAAMPREGEEEEVRTLETGFQRVVVMLAAIFLLLLAGYSAFLIWARFRNYAIDPSKGFHVPGVDPFVVVIAMGMAIGYIALFVSSKVRRGMEGYGDAINGLLLVGLPGVVGVGLSVLLSWAGVRYASEVAAGLFATLLVLQGLELVVNALRSYAGVEEFDQDPIDLQATPLVPMVSSTWINGIRLLASQSLGMDGGHKNERGVMARMIPRVAVALAALTVLVSMVRVVPVGHVAVVERFGHVVGVNNDKPTAEEVNKNLLHPGVHFTLPWFIDELVLISSDRVRSVEVGAEVQKLENMGPFAFEMWNVPHAKDTAEGRFITGDLNPQGQSDSQLLESFATVWWRVKDPGKFYLALSHSDFHERREGAVSTKPIYEAIVQRAAEEAMTSAFAQHTAESAMLSGRTRLEAIAKKVMQGHLEEKDGLDCGIEIVQFTINDVHPPYGQPNEAQKILGPAGAYEDVVAAIEEKSRIVHEATRKYHEMTYGAKGDASVTVLQAESYFDSRRNKATGDAAQLAGTATGFRDHPFAAQARVLYARMMESFPGSQKIILGPKVKPPNIWQEGKESFAAPRPPGS